MPPNACFFTVDRKSLRTNIYSQNTIYMFCLYHFSLKWIIKKNYLPPYGHLIGKVWVPVIHLFVSNTLQGAFESGQEARIVQIDFSSAFHRVNHLGILYMLCSMGIGGSVMSMLTQFLSNRSQQVMVDGCRSKLINVVSGMPPGSVLDPLLFLLYTSELFSILENKLIGYADDSILMAVVPSPGVRVAVAESLIRDLGRVSGWCDLWRMKSNASKTKTMIVSRSRTMHPQSSPLTIGGTVLKESDDLVILGVTFDSKTIFEKHLRSVSRAASQRLGILRKSWRVFHD